MSSTFTGIAGPDLTELTGAIVNHRPFAKINGNQDLLNYNFGNDIGQRRMEMWSSGTLWIEEIDLRDDGEAQVIGSYGEVAYGAPVNKQSLQVRIVNVIKGYMLDDFEMQDSLASKGVQALFRLTDSKRLPAYRAVYATKEKRFFEKPQDQVDVNTIYGLQYWCCAADPGTAAGSRGYLGISTRYTDGTASSTKGNINATTHDKWRNPVAVVKNNGGDELIEALRWLKTRLEYVVPQKLQGIEQSFKSQWEMFTGTENYLIGRRIAQSGTGDFTWENGMLMFDGQIEICWNQLLDSDPLRPWFFVNWSYWDIGVRPGMWFAEIGNPNGGGLRLPNRPTVQHWNVLTRLAVRCRNVRKGCGVVHLEYASYSAGLQAG